MNASVPVHVARLLSPGETIRYLTRPRPMSLGVLSTMTMAVLAVAAFSIVIEQPGFIGLLAVPGAPLIGGIGGYLLHAPVIFVSNGRLVMAARFREPQIFDLQLLEAVRIKQNALERRLGFGEVWLLFLPLENRGEGLFFQFKLSRVPDAAALADAITSAARSLREQAAEDSRQASIKRPISKE
jgi:hypothetical protein